jgi:predicted lactoylglutathione lyase
MKPLTAKDVKVFVPALNFAQSLEFYTSLGWKLNWKEEDDTLAELELAEQRFYLQNYYNKDWANNFMMHILVEDAQAWWQHASKVIAEGNHLHARLNKPKIETYGALVTHVWDPSGVLLHFAQMLEESHA